MNRDTNTTQVIVDRTVSDLKLAVLIVSVCVNVSVFVAWIAVQIV